MRVRTVGVTLSLVAAATPAWAGERVISALNPKQFAALKASDLNTNTIQYSQDIKTDADWIANFPDESKALALYPGYKGATYWKRKGGQILSAPEPLIYYFARTKTLLKTRANQSNLAKMVDYKNVQALLPDLTFGPTPITNAQLVASFLKAQKPPTSFNFCNGIMTNVSRHLFEINLDDSQPPASAREPWCSDAKRSLCFEACAIIADARVRPLIEGYNAMQASDQRKDAAEALQAEVRFFASETERGDAKGTFDAITKIGTEVTGVLDVSILYVNQIVQWGKVVVVLQADPADANRTIATTLVLIAVKSHSWIGAKGPNGSAPGVEEKNKAETVRKILKGEHFLNREILSGNPKRGLLGGIPMFTQDTTKHLADFLEAPAS